MNLSLSLALNDLMDKDFKLTSNEFHIFAPVNLMLKMPQFVLAFGSAKACLEESLVL